MKNETTEKGDALDEAKLLSKQATELFSVDTTFQEEKLNEEIERMLQKISEFVEVVEMIRSDTNICVNSILPLITEKSRELEVIFDRIDALEALVTHVNGTLTKLQSQADTAEAHFNTFTSIKNKIFGAITNFGVPKKHADTSPRYSNDPTTPSPDTEDQLESVNIFSTSEHFSSVIPSSEQ